MTTQDSIEFSAELPSDQSTVGEFEYYLSIEMEHDRVEFPVTSETLSHNAIGEKHGVWRYAVISKVDDVQLFEAATDSKKLYLSRPNPSDQKPLLEDAKGSSHSAKAIKVSATRAGGKVHDQTVVSIKPQETDVLANTDIQLGFLCIRSRAVNVSDTRYRVRLLEWDGASWGATLSVGKNWTNRSVPIGSMEPEDSLAMPMPYPNLSNFWKGAKTASLKGRPPAASNITEAQVSISEFDNPDLGWHDRSILIERIWLSSQSRCEI